MQIKGFFSQRCKENRVGKVKIKFNCSKNNLTAQIKNVFLPLDYNNKTILYTMEHTTTINGKKNRVTTVKPKPKKKSKYALWCEKNPNGVLTILDHKAVLQ